MINCETPILTHLSFVKSRWKKYNDRKTRERVTPQFHYRYTRIPTHVTLVETPEINGILNKGRAAARTHKQQKVQKFIKSLNFRTRKTKCLYYPLKLSQLSKHAKQNAYATTQIVSTFTTIDQYFPGSPATPEAGPAVAGAGTGAAE